MLKKIRAYFKEINDQVRSREISYVKHYIIQESITCKCGGTAIPVFDASNKYFCLKCKSRFANARHHLYDTLSSRAFLNSNGEFQYVKAASLYNDAVDQLKLEQ